VELLAPELLCVVCGAIVATGANDCPACGGPLVERGDVPELSLASIDVE
jgi:hypothetical protein